MVERGSAFPHEAEVAFDRNTGRYRVRFREKPQAEEERQEGSVEMPADLYNGMGWKSQTTRPLFSTGSRNLSQAS